VVWHRRLAKRERQHVVDVIKAQYAGIQVSLLSTQPSGPVRSGLLGRLFEDLTGTQRDSCRWVAVPRPDPLFLLDNPAQRNRRSCDGRESSVTPCLSRQHSLRGHLPAQAGHLFQAKSWTRLSILRRHKVQTVETRSQRSPMKAFRCPLPLPSSEPRQARVGEVSGGIGNTACSGTSLWGVYRAHWAEDVVPENGTLMLE